ncbi:MAG: hydroxymethylpyrimidine/phosphomethylpyrimidine kinase [Candidatus Thiodiazotropha sp. (ex Epidulcina cf. delphinae)]|nr:hydroxymethylpyrimidine/phosphomethylpyrimidine kinase [Candidatus Thiodiazotropha sp. (ex Epidulcina cf. delphinae)]
MVLAIGGHDPCGGAGVQADIESIGANGCHAASVITCLTVQDSCNVSQLIPTPADAITAQAQAVINDCPVSVIKIGLLGSLSAAEAVVSLLRDHPHPPVVFDPVLAAGGGSDLANGSLLQLLRRELLPLCSLVTPNTGEASRLTASGAGGMADDYGHALLGLGPQAALITGTHDRSTSSEVVNRLYQADRSPIVSVCPRLAGEFHGSGCTLAAAIAAAMACGEDIEAAVRRGLEYSWMSLLHGFRIGRCQSLPERLFKYPRQRPENDE